MKFLKLITFLVFIMKLLASALSVRVKKHFRQRHIDQQPELSFNPLPKEYHTAPINDFAKVFNHKHAAYNREHLHTAHFYHQNSPADLLQ